MQRRKAYIARKAQNPQPESRQMSKMRRTQDISTKTLSVLAILLVVVTALGTWAVLNTGTRIIVHSTDATHGFIRLEITGEQAHPPEQSSGHVALTIQ
jgi:hypothetical protein